MKTPNEQDLKINQLLATANIEFSALLVGATKRDEWDHLGAKTYPLIGFWVQS